jgi:hypothetical protein
MKLSRELRKKALQMIHCRICHKLMGACLCVTVAVAPAISAATEPVMTCTPVTFPCKVAITPDMPADMLHIEQSRYRDLPTRNLIVAETTATSMNSWGLEQGGAPTLKGPPLHVAGAIQSSSDFVPQ